MPEQRIPKVRHPLLKADSLLHFITTQSRTRLLLSLTCAYTVPVIFFGFAYKWLTVLRDENRAPVTDLLRSLYFSLMVQSTGGFLDISTGEPVGRFMVAAQTVMGIAWFAFLPALILIRLTAPDIRSVFVADKIAFNPFDGRFEFRYASFSKLMIFDTDVSLWARLPVRGSKDRFNSPVSIRASAPTSKRFSNIRPEVPFIIFTDSCKQDTYPANCLDDFDRELPPGTQSLLPHDFSEVRLHPIHIKLMKMKELVLPEYLHLNVSGSTSVGSVNISHAFEHSNIRCGSLRRVMDHNERMNWANFNEVVEIQETSQDNINYCLHKCGFRPHCSFINKVGS